jgi:hypothetical protein
MPNPLKKVLLPFVLLLTPFAFAQRPTGNAPRVGEASVDTLNIGLNIPLVSKKGVGMSFSLQLSFNYNFWSHPLGALWQPGNYGWIYANQYLMSTFNKTRQDDCNTTPPSQLVIFWDYGRRRVFSFNR